MKNIIKIVLVMLSAISFSAVQAGELNVTGTAKASYVINSSICRSEIWLSGKYYEEMGFDPHKTLSISGLVNAAAQWQSYPDC